MIGRRNLMTATMFGLGTTLLGVGSRPSSAQAKSKPSNDGFGATASVSVNSGNNSGNQTVNYQENQAIVTTDAAGNLTVQQANSVSGSVQQGSAASLPSTDGTGGQCGCDGPVPPGCDEISIVVKGVTVDFIPVRCLTYYCQGGS